jgi:hypothetical protein
MGMVYKLNKGLFLGGEEPTLRDEAGRELFSVTKEKDGAAILNPKGHLIAQITMKKGTATVVLADSAPLLISPAGNSFSIGPAPVDATEDIRDDRFHRVPSVEYILFGAPRAFRYTLYERRLRDFRPNLVASITEDIADQNAFKVRTEGGNTVKILLLVMAVAMLVKG